jgi:hypothetical protein
MLGWEGCLSAEGDSVKAIGTIEGSGVKARESLGVKAGVKATHGTGVKAIRESPWYRLSLLVLGVEPQAGPPEGGRDVPPGSSGHPTGTHRLWTHARVLWCFVCSLLDYRIVIDEDPITLMFRHPED